jgi:hypothetical protein
MRDFKKERGGGGQYLRMLVGLAGLVALAALGAVSARAAWGMYQKFAEASAADAAAQNELAAAQAQYASVSASVEALDTERGQEGALRERYGVARPGEGEIDIVRPATTTPAAADAPRGFWASLWHALFVW